jgi:hypothetical protein
MISKSVYIFVLLLVFINKSNAQIIIFGTNNYVEYQVGTLPFDISVGHGGNLDPASIPNRTCNNPVFALDVNTIETAMAIKNDLYAKTGCYPHLIISHLKRRKLDPNRNLADGACGNAQAVIAWNEFHNFIAMARNTANLQYNNKTFFVDLHGHGNPIQRIELGYLLYDDELSLSDAALNMSQYVNYSTIQNLVVSNVNNYSHSQLLRGPFAFGTLLSNQNYASVPSQSIPSPGINSNYFSGGYIVANHTCYAQNVSINGLQMELYYDGIRDAAVSRAAFADVFSDVLIDFMNTHFAMVWNSCNVLSSSENLVRSIPKLFPNPVKNGDEMHFILVKDQSYTYRIYTILGQEIKSGILNNRVNTITTSGLTSGIYIVELIAIETSLKYVEKVIID